MLKHDEILYRLKQMLISSGIPESHVKSEMKVYPPLTPGDGITDVAWDFEDIEHFANGIGFEIKTDSIKHYRYTGLRQLYNSAACGYYPALVCKRDVYEDDSGSASSFEELISPIGGIYVEMTEDPLSFNLVDEHMLPDLTIPDCLKNSDK